MQRANPKTPADSIRVDYPSGPTLPKGALVGFGSGTLSLLSTSDDEAYEVIGAMLRAVSAGGTAAVGVGSKLSLLLLDGLTPAKGGRLYLSATAGKATTALPDTGALIEVGAILDTTNYATDSTVVSRFAWKLLADLGA